MLFAERSQFTRDHNKHAKDGTEYQQSHFASPSMIQRIIIADMNGKSMYQVDEKELEVLIAKLEHTVAKLKHERPGSSELNHEAGILKDAKQLLEEKRRIRKPSGEVEFWAQAVSEGPLITFRHASYGATV